MDYQPNSNSSTIALVTLAAEIGINADELAQRFGDSVIVDAAGVRAVPAERSAAFIAALRAAQQAERDRRAAQREQARRRPNPVAQRVRALQAAQSQQPIGVSGEPVRAGEALAVLQSLDGHRDQRFDAAATQFDELARGTLRYHRINEGQD